MRRVVGGPVREAELTSGERLETDLVLVGTGVLPNAELAARAGIETRDGILVDEHGRTSAADVWAAGDCARFPLCGELIRLESVQNAIEQAEAVADDMLGEAAPYAPVPWFWSDQYDAKLQIAGWNRGYTEVVACDTDRGLSNWYYREGRLVAVDSDQRRPYLHGGEEAAVARDQRRSVEAYRSSVRSPQSAPVKARDPGEIRILSNSCSHRGRG